MIQEETSTAVVTSETLGTDDVGPTLQYRSDTTSSADELPPLAIAADNIDNNKINGNVGEGSVIRGDSVNNGSSHNLMDNMANPHTTTASNTTTSAVDHNGVASTLTKMGQSLLSSSGLLGGITGDSSGGYGGFLGDESKETENAVSTKNLPENRNAINSTSVGGLFDVVDEEERRRQQEAAAEKERLELEQAEKVRLARELQQENERRLHLEQQERNKEEQQIQEMNRMGMENSGVESSMQELNLNDDAQNITTGYRSATNESYGQAQQHPSSYPVPIENPSYSQPPLQQQQQQIQQAGFGGASYYYSTSGNVQQQIYSRGRSQPSQQLHTTSSTNINPSNGRHLAPLTNATNPSMYQGGPNNPSAVDEAQVSYAQRSQMRQASAPPNNYIQSDNPAHATEIPPHAGTYAYPNLVHKNTTSSSTAVTEAVASAGQMTMNNNYSTTSAHDNSVIHPHGLTSLRNNQSQQHGSVNQQSQLSHHGPSEGSNGGQPVPSKTISTVHSVITDTTSYPGMNSLPLPYDLSSFTPFYGKITVTDPILVQSPGVFSGPPHWTYNINVPSATKVDGQDDFAPITSVRRRFRHFVALEERIRVDCPGTILPPRPEKYAIRAIDEATTRQSAQFAAQRAQELEDYLNELRLHPLTGKSAVLHIFLTLPDHMGVAWPEVSSSLFTRLTEAGASTAVKVAEGTSAVVGELTNENMVGGEENSEMLALASAEGLRIGSVVQSVPKIEGSIALVDEYAERMNINGLEVQRLVKCLNDGERDIIAPFEILCTGLLRNGRRTKRLAVELSAAAQPFIKQYKICRYERMAFADRRVALAKRREAKMNVDIRAQKLAVVQQQHLQAYGNLSMMGRMENDGAALDEMSMDTIREADYVGKVVQMEVERIGNIRRKEWMHSLKIMAANMRETCAERVAIWEDCKQSFLTEVTSSFVDVARGKNSDTTSIESTGGNITEGNIASGDNHLNLANDTMSIVNRHED